MTDRDEQWIDSIAKAIIAPLKWKNLVIVFGGLAYFEYGIDGVIAMILLGTLLSFGAILTMIPLGGWAINGYWYLPWMSNKVINYTGLVDSWLLDFMLRFYFWMGVFVCTIFTIALTIWIIHIIRE